MTAQQIYDEIDRIAPFYTQADFDNCGLLIGSGAQEVDCVLLALDCTGAVVEEAVQKGAQLVLAHHPIIFHPLKSVLAGSAVFAAIQAGVSVLCAHTNLDVSPVGVNERLAQTLGLLQIAPLETSDSPYTLGRIGVLPAPLAPEELAQWVKERLHCQGLRFCAGARPVQKVAVCGGSGGSLLEQAIRAGTDALVSGDLRHDVFLAAQQAGLTLIDAGHFETETIILPHLQMHLQQRFPDVRWELAASNVCPVQTV